MGLQPSWQQYVPPNFDTPASVRASYDRMVCADLFTWLCGTAACIQRVQRTQVITTTRAVYRHALPLIAEAASLPHLHGRLLGIHLEGPFISAEPGYHGAHPRECVRECSVEAAKELWSLCNGHLRIMTLAPEVAGAEDVTQWLVAQGVIVSAGHSAATAEQLARVVRCGATMATHVGNGTPQTLPRHDNFVWAAMANDAVFAGIITDGFHLPVDVIKTALRAKTIDRAFVVSDLAPVGGLAAGEYECFGTVGAQQSQETCLAVCFLTHRCAGCTACPR